MSEQEVDIIRKLSANAAEPNIVFARTLSKQLLEQERLLKINYRTKRRHIMNFKKLSFAVVGLLLVVGATVFLLNKNSSKEDAGNEMAQSQQDNNSKTQTSSLPNQQANSLDQAKKALTFTPLTPSQQISDETLSTIKVGTKSGMIDDSDTVYLTYSDSKGTLYKMSQSTKKFNYPTDAEKISLTIYGKQVAASYYKLEEVESGGVNSVGGDVSSPTSYIFWDMGSVTFEISEFGRVTKQQLLDLAASLK